MNRVAILSAVAAFSLGVPATAQDRIGTIERGTYVCELPGDAEGGAGVPQPQESFSIDSASRYSSEQGEGTYLRRGDIVILTSGPRNGERFRIMSQGFLRKLDDGEPGRLRCIRSGS